MGSRGPKPGFKAARAAALAAGDQPAKPTVKTPAPKQTAPKATDTPPPKPEAQAEAAPVLSAADRENPNKLSGQSLKDLAYRRGMSRSEMEHMDDDKIRMQLRYITARFAEEELA